MAWMVVDENREGKRFAVDASSGYPGIARYLKPKTLIHGIQKRQ
jgi:hypothetical protein